MLLLPLGTGFVLFAAPVIRLLYGGQYVDATSAVRLLGCATALYGLSYVSSYILISQDRQRAIMWITAAVTVENVGLNLLLIPRWSLNGAAAVTSVSEVTYTVLLAGIALRVTGPISLSRIAIGPVVACGGMALIALVLGPSLATLLAAALVYLLLLFLVERRLHPADVGLALTAVGRRRTLA